MRKELTDAFLRSIEPPRKGRAEYVDIRCTGLEFRITKGGVRSWSYRFVDPEGGGVARATLGKYPALGLSAARAAANEMRKAVAAERLKPATERRRPLAPAEQERQQRESAAGKSFKALTDLYMAAVSDPASDRFKRSAEQDRAKLEKHVLPKWRDKRYDRITRGDVVELIEALVKAGSPVQANRVQALLSGIFNFAIDGGLVEANPCARLRKRGAEGIGRRVLNDAELRLFWPRIIHSPVSLRTGQGLRLALLLGARIGEVAGMARDEFAYLDDAERAVWTIPGGRRKNGEPHLVPLSATARRIVLQLVETSPESERFLFPARLAERAAIEPHTFATAMRRFGEQIKGGDASAKTWRADPPSPHDLRRTVRTRLAALGVSREIRDHVLGHGVAAGGVGERHYNLYDFAREKRDALAAWDAALANILEPASAVVSIAVARR